MDGQYDIAVIGGGPADFVARMDMGKAVAHKNRVSKRLPWEWPDL